jgi:hypothetical protein
MRLLALPATHIPIQCILVSIFPSSRSRLAAVCSRSVCSVCGLTCLRGCRRHGGLDRAAHQEAGQREEQSCEPPHTVCGRWTWQVQVAVWLDTRLQYCVCSRRLRWLSWPHVQTPEHCERRRVTPRRLAATTAWSALLYVVCAGRHRSVRRLRNVGGSLRARSAVSLCAVTTPIFDVEWPCGTTRRTTGEYDQDRRLGTSPCM